MSIWILVLLGVAAFAIPVIPELYYSWQQSRGIEAAIRFVQEDLARMDAEYEARLARRKPREA